MTSLNIVSLVIVAIAAIFIALNIYFTYSMYTLMNLVSQENRMLTPWTVWLIYVPVLGFIWAYVVFFKIAKSLELENLKRSVKIEKIYQSKVYGVLWITIALTYSFFPQHKIYLGILLISSFIAHLKCVYLQIKQLKSSELASLAA